jgi:hypothetical protein
MGRIRRETDKFIILYGIPLHHPPTVIVWTDCEVRRRYENWQRLCTAVSLMGWIIDGFNLFCWELMLHLGTSSAMQTSNGPVAGQ